MYQFSRAIYRDLAEDIVPDRPGQFGPGNHEKVLKACEETVWRLMTDRHYFAKPAKTLFNDIRFYFPMKAQARVFVVVSRHMMFAEQFLNTQPAGGFDLLGNRVECRATTRKGRPCQRTPLPHNGYCPSHQHLAETEEVALAA